MITQNYIVEIKMRLSGAILRNFSGVGSPVTQPKITNYFSLKVPHYQRPYKWGSDRIETLIKDWKENIIDKCEEEEKKYFAGSVVTVADPNENFHSLIDGQQRITTLFLTNFINFTLLRRLILSEIGRQRCGYIREYSQKLQEAAQFIFNDSKILSEIKAGVVELKKLSDADEMTELHKQNNPLERVREILWIPMYNNEEKYILDFHNLMKEKIEDASLNLHYDRSSFNKSLKKVLEQFYLDFGDTKELTFKNLEEKKLAENEKVYSNALITILKTFENEFQDKSIDIYKRMHSLHDRISEFLDQVQVCVIQTENTEDAYTLFEVMNDRALALDDLDLIKNQFFKKFVNTNPELDNSQMDEIIQKLDDQWGDDIFHHKNMNQTLKKLVTYLSTVYITKATELKNESNEKYRVNLNTYLSMDKYTQKNIKRDFNIFETCFKILKSVDLPLIKKENYSIVAHYENETDFKKALYFLNASQQDGVISGLFNFTLATIETINSDFNQDIVIKIINLILDKKVDKEKVKSELEVDERKAIEILNKINNIHKQAKVLWKSSIMANSAELPREISRQIIEANYISSNERDLLEVKNLDFEKHQKEFEGWLNSWQYKPKMLLKVKTLFASIIQYSLNEENKLIVKPVTLSVSPDVNGVMELDHMVPQNPAEPSILDFIHSDRDLYINGLGNMMPLPKPNNIEKSNESIEKAFKYYEKAGLRDHFLIKQAMDSVQHVIDGTKEPEDFFTERKKQLIEYFKQII